MERHSTAELSNDDQAFLGQLINKTKIYECLKRVSRGIDRFDRAQFLSAYHPDATISAGTLVARPAEVFAGGSALHEEGQKRTLHHLTNHRCEIDGDVAHCETYYFYAAHNHDGATWLAGGRYVDRVERRRGEWRIAFRHTLLEWSSIMEGMDVPLFNASSDADLNGVSSRGHDDPSYRRPFVNMRDYAVPTQIAELGRVERQLRPNSF